VLLEHIRHRKSQKNKNLLVRFDFHSKMRHFRHRWVLPMQDSFEIFGCYYNLRW